MPEIHFESIPLTEKDFFYMVEQSKDHFTEHLHQHDFYELHFAEHCNGTRRIVGDSVEDTGDYDLVLLGSGVSHTWCSIKRPGHKIKEISIYFSPDFINGRFGCKREIQDIVAMLKHAANGIAFDMGAIMRAYNRLLSITQHESGFYRMSEFMSVLHELAAGGNYRMLSSTAPMAYSDSEPQRITVVKDYIINNYMSEIRLNTLAELAKMTPTAYSRFFKGRTGCSVSDFIIDIRLDYASRKLLDTDMPISDVCYDCGFNNVSNFNRIFKKKKGCSPKEFRDSFHRKTILT